MSGKPHGNKEESELSGRPFLRVCLSAYHDSTPTFITFITCSSAHDIKYISTNKHNFSYFIGCLLSYGSYQVT